MTPTEAHTHADVPPKIGFINTSNLSSSSRDLYPPTYAATNASSIVMSNVSCVSPQGQNNPQESRISYENGLIFESLYQPRLEGELKNAESDLDLHGKFVQVVGYVQQQELGNCFLSFHIVEPAIHPADGFDR